MAGSSSECFTISPQLSSDTEYYLTASGSDVTLTAKKDKKAKFLPNQLWEIKKIKKNNTEAARSGMMARSSRFFKISQEQPCGTKYYLTASGRNVTLIAEKDEKAAEPATQLWEIKKNNEAFFWTASNDLGDRFYIQKASDPEFVLDALERKVILRKKRPARSNPKEASLWELETSKPEAPTHTGAMGSGSHTEGMHTGEDPAGGDPEAADAVPPAGAPSNSRNTNRNPA